MQRQQPQIPQRIDPDFFRDLSHAIARSMARSAMSPQLMAVPTPYPMSSGYGYPMSYGGYGYGGQGGQGYGNSSAEQQPYGGQRLENRNMEAQPSQAAADPATRIIQKMDNDGDGKISSKEARGMFLEYFDKLDLDHDGYLEHDEVEAALRHYPVLATRESGVPSNDVATSRSGNGTNTTGANTAPSYPTPTSR
jgi:hypothetical protein